MDGAYNARDYQHLNVASEVRDLFQYIERYKPHEVQLEAPLRCFIPDYIPAIGELDAFIKVRYVYDLFVSGVLVFSLSGPSTMNI